MAPTISPLALRRVAILLTLTATNQFSGSAGADIVSPYSDISIGTNGPLIITNLLQAALPNWNGTVEAWSGRWLTLSSNTVDGINYYTVSNDLRVLLIRSQLTPTTLAQVRATADSLSTYLEEIW